MCRIDRVNAVEYLEWVGKSFDELFVLSPLIDKKIYEEYINLAKKNGNVLPDEYDITVNISKNHEQVEGMKDTSVIFVNHEISDKNDLESDEKSDINSDIKSNTKSDINSDIKSNTKFKYKFGHKIRY